MFDSAPISSANKSELALLLRDLITSSLPEDGREKKYEYLE